MSKKILIIAGIAILLTLIFGVFVLLQINNLRKPQVSSLEAQAKAIQNQIQQIDSEYRQKMNEITDKQKQNIISK